MSIYDNYQNLITDFNELYGTNFSYEAFEAEVNALRNRNSSGSLAESANEVYVNTYKKIFKDAVFNAVQGKLHTVAFNHDNIARDYENMMNKYIEANVNAGNFTQMKWIPKSQLLSSLKTEVKSYPDNGSDYIAQKYLNGELRIRDMRARTNSLIDHFKTARAVNTVTLAGIWTYADALEKVNKSRPLWWRWLHPFRNSAEKRQAKEIRQFLTTAAEKHDRESTIKFQESMQEIWDYNTLVKLRDGLENQIDIFRFEEKKMAENKSNANDAPQNENDPNRENAVSNVNESDKKNNLNLGNESKRENIGEHVKEDVQEEVNKKQPKKEKPTAMQKFNEVTEQDGFMNEFTKELADIIARYSQSPNTHTIKEYLSDFLFNWTKDLCTAHDDAVSNQTRESEIGREMGSTVNSLYTGVLSGMDMYGVSIENRPIVAQLVVDHALKKLSPAGFFPEKYGKYANRYTIEANSNDVVQAVQDCSYSLNRQDCVRICDNAKEQLREMDRISKETNENVEKDEEIQNEQIEDRKLDNSMVK